MGKAVSIRMVDKADGKAFIWKARYIPSATNIVLGKKPRKISGWQITDHEGCERFSEGNWLALVPYLHLLADNYGFACKVS